MRKISWVMIALLTIGFAGVALAGPQGGDSQGHSQGAQGQDNDGQ
jgi:hypothetical protein